MRSTISIRSTTLVLFLVFFAMLFHCAVHAQTPAPKPSDALPAWAASSDQLSLLDAEVTYSGFKVRPPIGYALIPVADNAPYSTMFEVTTLTLPKDGPLITARDALMKRLVAIRTQYYVSGVSPIENGSLNNVACVRVYWKGILRKTKDTDPINRITHGLIYVTLSPDSRTYVMVQGGDSDPYYSQTSKELEAAVLTLKSN